MFFITGMQMLEKLPFVNFLKRKVKSVIIKEKIIAQSTDQLPLFNEKWENYTAIYDYRGPDNQIYS
jgi:hypothetical protein